MHAEILTNLLKLFSLANLTVNFAGCFPRGFWTHSFQNYLHSLENEVVDACLRFAPLMDKSGQVLNEEVQEEVAA
jgi:hypothetical protein